MLCNAALMVRLSNFYSSFKPNFSRIFCSSFKLFENQTVRLSRVHCSNIVVPVVLYECQNCSVAWKEKITLRVF
jgi:hypothetical protein